MAPDLLGRPLATPARRAAAMAIDLALAGLLTLAGGIVFGLAFAAALWRVPARATRGFLSRRPARWLFRGLSACTLTITLVAAAETWFGEEDAPGAETDPTLSAGAAFATLGSGIAFYRTGDSLRARALADSTVARLTARGTPRREIAGILAELAAEEDLPRWKRTLLRDRASALETAAAADSEPDPVTVLAEENAALEAANGRLIQQRDLARAGFSPLRLVRNVADELGLGFGWFALYFTAFLAIWKGQTPGKRLLHLRVVRLSGRRLSWWHAFTRFGGYAACVATGLLGFAEILWDANRQGLHDKVAGTVVVHEPSARGVLRGVEWRGHLLEADAAGSDAS